MIQRLVLLKREGWIDEADLVGLSPGHENRLPQVTLPAEGVDFAAMVDRLENDLIEQALETTGWNKNQAAQLLGLKRTTLVEKIRSKGIQPKE